VKIVLVFGAVLAAAVVGLLVWAWTPDLKRADLEAIYLASPGDMVEISGVRLHPRGDYSEARNIEIVLAALNRLRIAQATLVGNSIGGRVA